MLVSGPAVSLIVVPRPAVPARAAAALVLFSIFVSGHLESWWCLLEHFRGGSSSGGSESCCVEDDGRRWNDQVGSGGAEGWGAGGVFLPPKNIVSFLLVVCSVKRRAFQFEYNGKNGFCSREFSKSEKIKTKNICESFMKAVFIFHTESRTHAGPAYWYAERVYLYTYPCLYLAHLICIRSVLGDPPLLRMSTTRINEVYKGPQVWDMLSAPFFPSLIIVEASLTKGPHKPSKRPLCLKHELWATEYWIYIYIIYCCNDMKKKINLRPLDGIDSSLR